MIQSGSNGKCERDVAGSGREAGARGSGSRYVAGREGEVRLQGWRADLKRGKNS